MTTLIIDFFLQDPEIRIKGLSLKALNGSNIWQVIYKDPDDGRFRIDSHRRIDGRTAKIEEDYLVKILIELNTIIPFNRIKTRNYYPISGDDLFKAVCSVG